jgi:large subunit ribosomal protein L32
MAVPKFKTSKSRTRTRRSHDALTPVQMVPCLNCGLKILRHRVCPDCGHYRTRHGAASTRLVVVKSEA